MLPELGKVQGAHLGEKLRRLIDGEPFVFDNISIPVTMSMGVSDLLEYREAVAALGDPELNPFAFVKISDDRLYVAKQSGRNRVVM